MIVLEWEYKHGLMVLDMKESGKKIKHMEEENSGMLMVIFLKGTGKMIKQMGTEYIFM